MYKAGLLNQLESLIHELTGNEEDEAQTAIAISEIILDYTRKLEITEPNEFEVN